MSSGVNSSVPPVLQQKCIEVAEFSSDLSYSSLFTMNGKIITWKGNDTGYIWTSDETGKFFVYQNCKDQARLKFVHQFDTSTTVNSVIYYPASETCHGLVVAATNLTESNYLAYFSLRTGRLLKAFTMPHTVICMCNIYDGTTPHTIFSELCSQFHTGWNDILLVGCQRGFAYLVRLDVASLVEEDRLSAYRASRRSFVDDDFGDDDALTTEKPKLVRTKHLIPLTKLFQGEKMFIYQADDGRQLCLEKEAVAVSAVHYLEKCKVVMIGFNFGGIVFVSLATSKINTYYFGEGIVQFFAVQEPEDDPRPILYYWTCVHNPKKGAVMILSVINFPKDEVKDLAEYTYLEPVAYPLLKWSPENCDEMLSVQTLNVDRRSAMYHTSRTMDDTEDGSTADRSAILRASSPDTSLLLIVWQKRVGRGAQVYGSLFDMNAFYAKRLSSRVVPDSTAARQYPFLSRFFCDEVFMEQAMDAYGLTISRYSAPAYLKKSIDQLFYPSTIYITFNLLTMHKLRRMKVQPLQLQLICDLTENVVEYFDNPSDPCRWICALGLANSAPTSNLSEERACFLRVLIHIFLPGIFRLIEASMKSKENLRYIHRWIWREVELTKAKFDDLCDPIFSGAVTEPSPDTCDYVHHASSFFRRARSILENLQTVIDAFDDDEWKESLALQCQATRQVEMFSIGIAFGLDYKLLPLRGSSQLIHSRCRNSMKIKFRKARKFETTLQIQELVGELMHLNPKETVWNSMTADAWFPPPDFARFLPVLLLMNISETSKISLLGYYFLEYDAITLELDGFTPTEMFQKCCSLFMLDNFSTALQSHIKEMWFIDNKSCEFPPTVEKHPATRHMEIEKKIYNLPLSTKVEISHAKSEYMKLEHGVHLFNRDMIQKRRYNLIIEPPPPAGSAIEPEFVIKCREEVAKIRVQFSWLAASIDPLPESIMQKFRDRVMLENKEKRENIVHVPARKSILPERSSDHSLTSKSRKRKSDVVPDNDYEEELPLTIATPAKRHRPIMFSLSTPTSAKVWNRVNRVVQTPISLRETEDREGSSPPRELQLPQTPVSILKSNKKQKDGNPLRSRLRFENVPQMEPIPTRAEVAMEETHNGSFTNFGSFNDSPSPHSSIVSAPIVDSAINETSVSQPVHAMTTPVKSKRTSITKTTPTKSIKYICNVSDKPLGKKADSSTHSELTITPIKSQAKRLNEATSTTVKSATTKSPRKNVAITIDSVHVMQTRSKSPRKHV